MTNELEEARRERDEAFAKLLEASAKITKHNVEATKYRKAFTIASDTVRSLERDLISYPSLA